MRHYSMGYSDRLITEPFHSCCRYGLFCVCVTNDKPANSMLWLQLSYPQNTTPFVMRIYQKWIPPPLASTSSTSTSTARVIDCSTPQQAQMKSKPKQTRTRQNIEYSLSTQQAVTQEIITLCVRTSTIFLSMKMKIMQPQQQEHLNLNLSDSYHSVHRHRRFIPLLLRNRYLPHLRRFRIYIQTKKTMNMAVQVSYVSIWPRKGQKMKKGGHVQQVPWWVSSFCLICHLEVLSISGNIIHLS